MRQKANLLPSNADIDQKQNVRVFCCKFEDKNKLDKFGQHKFFTEFQGNVSLWITYGQLPFSVM